MNTVIRFEIQNATENYSRTVVATICASIPNCFHVDVFHHHSSHRSPIGFPQLHSMCAVIRRKIKGATNDVHIFSESRVHAPTTRISTCTVFGTTCSWVDVFHHHSSHRSPIGFPQLHSMNTVISREIQNICSGLELTWIAITKFGNRERT